MHSQIPVCWAEPDLQCLDWIGQDVVSGVT